MRHATTFNEFRPSVFEALYFLKEWRANTDLVANKQRLDELFLVQPFELSEQSLSEKVHLLNDIYGTHTQETIVTHLSQINNLELRISQGDLSVVDDIQASQQEGAYSFATKFCHHHNPIAYPFFSFTINNTLYKFENRDHFYGKHYNYNNYSEFYNAMQAFRNHYGLETCSWFYIDILLKGSSTLN